MEQPPKYIAIVLLSLLFWAPLPALAFDLGTALSVNGFLSQGFIDSHNNNYLGNSLDGSFQLNEFGLTLNSQVTDNLRVGLQLLSRDVGNEGNNKVILDWGMLDYRLRDGLGIRLGKIKLPIGLYNQGRDSDFLRPMVFLPQSVYDDNKRNLYVAATGGSLYGNLTFGPGGDLAYQAYYGRVTYHEDSGQARGMLNLATNLAKKKKLGTVSNFNSENKYVYGGSLIYSPPLEGVRLGVSYFTGKSEFDFDLRRLDTSDSPPQWVTSSGDAQGHNKDFVVVSFEYTKEQFLVAAEYMEFTGDRVVLGTDLPDGRSQGGYVQLCYHLLDPLGLSVLYDVFYVDKDDHDGSNLVAQGSPDFWGWRKDLGIGLHWEVTDSWLLKAEWHKVKGAALQLPLFNPDGAKEDWSYLVLKASYNF